MRSSWVPLALLVLYLALMVMVARLLDLLVWCHQGMAPTDMVDPLLLSVRQLKQLLEIRGVSYTGYYEKRELAHLVESSADVSHGELEELDKLVGQEEKERLVKTPQTSHFSGSAHFYEQVEDTKDSVWLVQVVPATGHGEALLDDYKWRIVRHHVAPFAIRTGVFDCKLDRRLCKNKGWNEPLLLLAMPKGTTPKDKVVIRTCTYTRPQQILTWMAEQLSIRVHKVSSMQELEEGWLRKEEGGNETSMDRLRDVKVLLLTHILHPPLFLAALSIKFTGRIKFGMMTMKKEEEGAVGQRLKQQLRSPSYLVVTPERTVVYGRRHGEHFNFWAMNALLRAVQPDSNDVFLCSLVLANMVAFLQIVQVGASSWWKRLACGVWTFVSYNLWLFAAWLLVLGTHRWSVFSTVSDQLLVVVRSFVLTDIGNNLRNDCLLFVKHPLFFLASFLLFVFITKRFISTSSVERESEERPWWEVLPLDCLFRPMASLSRPLPPSEIQLEEGIELLIERLATPNLWLQPSVILNDYIKDLPKWRYQVVTESERDSRDIVNLMDRDNHCKYDSSSEESLAESREEEFVNCPVKGMLPTSSCAVCLEVYHNNTLLCGLPCGHNYHSRCIFTWLQTDNHHCPICRWPVYKSNHPRFFKTHQE